LTYHGPGQLVFYFIFSLKERGWSIPQFVKKIEELGLKLCQAQEVPAHRKEKCPGLWLGEKKIASLGLYVHQGVSMHGMALNVDPDLEDFQWIIPCGIQQAKITSLSKETGKKLTVSSVIPSIEPLVAEIFNA
ncbi:MAG: lipoyl(octanoyl) transferase LipB, partial [Deltaproteobacteria bacterium]|nr:lipoyl(octanoyl) transferase LipB [Deltaproteobacteria bacterium]